MKKDPVEIPLDIQKEIKRIEKAEKMRRYRRSKYEGRIDPELLAKYYADKSEKY